VVVGEGIDVKQGNFEDNFGDDFEIYEAAFSQKPLILKHLRHVLEFFREFPEVRARRIFSVSRLSK